jgi:hypothetical protein
LAIRVEEEMKKVRRAGLVGQKIVLAAGWEKWRRDYEARQRAFGMNAEEAKAETERAWGRVAARRDWLRAQLEELRRLDRIVFAQFCAYADAHPEIDWEAPDAPDLPETAELAAMHAIEDVLDAVRERDAWPHHLYWGKV